MIFRRKKRQTDVSAQTPVLRGRDRVENSVNPLARRFHPEDEPDTIDLQQPAGFNTEPGTAELSARRQAPESLGIINLVPETGKIYVQRGDGDLTVFLDDEPVLAPTELRPGDRVRIRNLELQISRVQKDR